jgi:hypothetical protein
MEANIALGVLEDEGIKAFLENENMTILMPMAGEGQGIKLIVSEEDRERANDILEKLNKDDNK